MPTNTTDEVEQAAARTAEANAALADANAEISRLERAILEGDDTIKGIALSEAEAEVRRSELLLTRAEGLERQAREQARKDRIEAVRRLIRENFGAHEGDVVQHFDAAVESLRRMITEIDLHNAGMRELLDEIRDLAVPTLEIQDRNVRIRDLDVTFGPIDPVELSAAAAFSALTSAGHRDSSDALYRLGGIMSSSDGGPADRLRRTMQIVAARDAS